jgi:hypothetical protein
MLIEWVEAFDLRGDAAPYDDATAVPHRLKLAVGGRRGSEESLM